MIPNRIYYFWQKDKPLSDLALKCIASWKKFFPNYEIIQINESNFDVYQCCFSKVAWEAKRYAYLSDYARVKTIYENGGIYFDLDVEVINDFKDIIEKGNFFGLSYCGNGNYNVNTGLGFGCEKNNEILKELVDLYESWDGDKFYDERNFPILPACPIFNWKIFESFGVKPINKAQNIGNNYFYPTEVFEPYNFIYKELHLSPDTKTIHWYNDKNNYIKGDAFVYKYRSKLTRKFHRELTEREFNIRFRLFHPIRAFIFHNSHKRIKNKK